MALMLKPKILIIGEPTSALDAVIWAQVLNLLMDLKDRLKLTYLSITHNITVAYYISDSAHTPWWI